MKRSRRGPWAPIARGVLLLAAVLLLPLAAMPQSPRESAAQSAGQDLLWAGANDGSIGVCADPSSTAALSGCFASAATTWTNVDVQAVASDGVNVYFVSQTDGGLSCPIADLGANCTRIMAGPWPSKQDYGAELANGVFSLAAANGQIWFGDLNGQIYRCPANLPYANQNTAPSQCVLLDEAGNHGVGSLLLANGTLYAGLASNGTEQKKQGLLWSCSPDTVNACSTLDSYGDTAAYSLAAGGGYLWAGLQNGIIWRCDLNAANACANWEQAGCTTISGCNAATSLSYDGAGTLFAAIQTATTSNKPANGVVWSCPTAYANGCSNIMSNVDGTGNSVAAGAGDVFSSSGTAGLHFGTSPFAAANPGSWQSSRLLYLPADGPAGVGGVSVKVTAKAKAKAKGNAFSQKFGKRCDKPGQTARATVTITGPNFTKTMKAGACALVKNGVLRHNVDLLDPGDYTVTVKAGKNSGKASFTIMPDRTKPVNVKLARGLHH